MNNFPYPFQNHLQVGASHLPVSGQGAATSPQSFTLLSGGNTYRSVKHGTLLSLCAGVITFTCILQSAGLTSISVIYSSEARVTLACLAVGSVSAHWVSWTVVVTSTGVYLLITVTSSHTRVGTSTGWLKNKEIIADNIQFLCGYYGYYAVWEKSIVFT